MNRNLRRAFPWLTCLVGLIIAVPAAMHVVAVIGVAYGERAGYDARLADLLWIGWTSLVCGLLLLAAIPALLRGSAVALRVAAGAAATFLVGTLLIAPVSPKLPRRTADLRRLLLVAAVVNRHDVGTDHVSRAMAGTPR